MSTETGFNTEWLEERFSFDSQARNTVVENACFTLFADKKTLNILDLGSGSGSSFLYLSEKLPQDQYWSFVELNPILANASLERISGIASGKGWKVVEKSNGIIIGTQNKSIEIEVINHSFLELEERVDLEKFDLATAAAVLDLLTENMLHDLLNLLSNNGVSLLATINYEGMKFTPSGPGDAMYINLYGQHMQREQSFGRTLGPDCLKSIKAYGETSNLKIISGESNWQVGRNDQKMHTFLLDYMAGAIPDMLTSNTDVTAFEHWLWEKREMVERQNLESKVFHFDVFIKNAKAPSK